MRDLRLPMRRSALLASLSLCTAGAAFAQTAPSLQLRSLAATCAACHGTDGKAVVGEAMARLAGLPKEQIVTSLQAFRDGTRPATVMHQISKGYNNEQIDSIAAYFAAQK